MQEKPTYSTITPPVEQLAAAQDAQGKVAQDTVQWLASKEPGAKAEHFVTEGEKRFDWRTYMGVGYLLNAAISVAAVYWAERTHIGQRTITKTGEFLGDLFKVNKERAAALTKKTLFLTGGFAVLAPMKWMEDNKAETVKKLNREIYGEQAEQDPKILQSEKELEQAPKQGWSSLMSSRALALVPFYILMGFLWDNKSGLSRLTNSEFRKMGKAGVEALEKSNPEQFNQMAAKGLYVERPIAFVSRKIGKFWAKITGNQESLDVLTQMEKQHPGALHSGLPGTKHTDSAMTAVAHITLSESITSYVVAKSVYFLSRILGPFFGKGEAAAQGASANTPAQSAQAPMESGAMPQVPVTPEVAKPHANIQAKTALPATRLQAAPELGSAQLV